VSEFNAACPEAYATLKTAVEAGLRIVREHEKSGKYILSHSEFPELDYFDSGLPRISRASWASNAGPKDYNSVFRDDHHPDNIPEWEPFVAFAESHHRLKAYYDDSLQYRPDVDAADLFRVQMHRFSIQFTIEKLVSRYIHLTNSKEFDEAMFRPVYREWEVAVFADQVVFDIVIPLLMVKFDFEALDLGDDQWIEKMSDDFQLARGRERRFPVSANECVVGAATHALVLRHWSIKNGSHHARSESLSNVEGFRSVLHRVDHFFSALRAVAGVQTGYSQLIVRADGWGDSYTAHLPQVSVIPLRSYPDHFENYGWLRTPPVLDESTCKEVGTLYRALLTLNKNQLSLAARRLNMALLRSSEQDSILDVTIGLETLLVPDGGRGEITHKLAMRLAALTKMHPFETYKPREVFDLCKKLYDYRSAVAHGSGDVEKKRVIKVQSAKETIPTIAIGTSLLRYAIRLLAQKSELLDAKTLDMTLFPDSAALVTGE
jgi:hypothetical protein